MQFLLPLLGAAALLAQRSAAGILTPSIKPRSAEPQSNFGDICGNKNHGDNKGLKCTATSSGPCCGDSGVCGSGPEFCSIANLCQPAFGQCTGKTTDGHSKLVGSYTCGPANGYSCAGNLCCGKDNKCGTSDGHCLLPNNCQPKYGHCKEPCPPKAVLNSGFEDLGLHWTFSTYSPGKAIVDYPDVPDPALAHNGSSYYASFEIQPGRTGARLRQKLDQCLGATYKISVFTRFLRGKSGMVIYMEDEAGGAEFVNSYVYRGPEQTAPGYIESTGRFTAKAQYPYLSILIYNADEPDTTNEPITLVDDLTVTRENYGPGT